MREIIADSRMMHIGKNGEGDALRVTFPVVGEWEALYGAGGVWTLNVQRHGDALAYAAQDFTIEDGAAVWVVTDADAAVVGEGRCELTYKIGDTVAKSRTYAFRVDRSLTGGGNVPDPVKGWQEALEKRVDGKLDRPDGGSAGDVLTKTEAGEEWKRTRLVIEAQNDRGRFYLTAADFEELKENVDRRLVFVEAYGRSYVFDKKDSWYFYGMTLKQNSSGKIAEEFIKIPRDAAGEVTLSPEDSATDAIIYTANQLLTEEQKETARKNIGAQPAGDYLKEIPAATAKKYGGVKADAATAEDTQPARIGADGRLYVPKAPGGSGETDLSLGLTSAQVGQIVKVKAVDENGKPTKWEAGNLTGGLPNVTEENNGQFLRVVNGAWAADAVPSAGGVSF